MKNIKDYIALDPATPSGLRWIKSPAHHVKVTDLVGSSINGYWRFMFAGKYYWAHRLVLEFNGETCPEGFEPDHINRNRSDNRIENLRWVSKSINTTNRGVRNSTGFRYVKQEKNGNFCYHIQRKHKQLASKGGFKTASAAHAAALAKRKELGLLIPN